jgi:hypothetical protein
MKSSLGIFAALVIGALVGWYLGRLQTRAAILSGPYSDNYGPALAAISEAKSKLQSGDTNLFEHLSAAEFQIKEAQEWSQRFLGQRR